MPTLLVLLLYTGTAQLLLLQNALYNTRSLALRSSNETELHGMLPRKLLLLLLAAKCILLCVWFMDLQPCKLSKRWFYCYDIAETSHTAAVQVQALLLLPLISCQRCPLPKTDCPVSTLLGHD